ncbi:hypothetical protein SLEP1_g35228 [Rubroshorea leprosula]|uniref:Uncharacterized protein n=1 Tax=Rubroshorea leprosula TaxID=152421 RepID=A0AAV5KMJ3_9ROSI|nr:hypothetical protein SLEP1_g35228 [Rubroshorea leprosula]
MAFSNLTNLQGQHKDILGIVLLMGFDKLYITSHDGGFITDGERRIDIFKSSTQKDEQSRAQKASHVSSSSQDMCRSALSNTPSLHLLHSVLIPYSSIDRTNC